MAVWTEDGDAPVGGSGSGIAARVDNGAGTPATFLIVNTSIAGDQLRPGIAALNVEATRQAAMVAYIDDFKLMMIIIIVSLPLLLLLRRPRPIPRAAAVAHD